MGWFCTDNPVCQFYDAITFLAWITIVFTALLLWRFYKHPMIAPRFPELIVWEVMLSMFKVAAVGAIFGSFHEVWTPFPCMVQTAFHNGLDFAMRLSSTARFSMLALQMASNGLFSFPNKFLKHYTWFLCAFTAPGEYYQYVRRLHLTEPTATGTATETKDAGSVGRVSSPPKIGSVSTPVSEFQNPFLVWVFSAKMASYGGRRRFSMVMILWWIFGALFVNFLSWSVRGIEEAAKPLTMCWDPQLYLLGAWQILWGLMNIPFFFIFNSSSDAIGLRNEILITLFIETISSFIGSYALLRHNVGQSLWTGIFDLGSIFIPPFITVLVSAFYIMMYEIHQRNPVLKFKARVRGGSSRPASQYSERSIDFASPGALELFWSRGGDQIVIELARQRYFVEATSYLKATDNSASITLEEYKQLYVDFVRAGSPYQLNLPIETVRKWGNSVENATIEQQLVSSVRQEMFTLLLTNLGANTIALAAKDFFSS